MSTNKKHKITVTAEKAGTPESGYRVQVNEHPGVNVQVLSRANIARVARNSVSQATGVPASRLVVTKVEFK